MVAGYAEVGDSGTYAVVVEEGAVPAGIAFGSKAKAVVASEAVFVIGGSVSPGPWIVEVTPFADPSSTVS